MLSSWPKTDRKGAPKMLPKRLLRTWRRWARVLTAVHSERSTGLIVQVIHHSVPLATTETHAIIKSRALLLSKLCGDEFGELIDAL
jgi:hypothetical protein